jgi:5-methylcytosine-specific restriction enzyme A
MSKRLYGYAWQKARKGFLAKHPLCQCPNCDEGHIRLRVASVVDHKVAHRGDYDLFWDRDNWQSMAKDCHDSYKQRIEKSGRIAGADGEGVPVDPRHHWNDAGGGSNL